MRETGLGEREDLRLVARNKAAPAVQEQRAEADKALLTSVRGKTPRS